MATISIISADHLLITATEPQTDLKSQFREQGFTRPRRVSRYTELALLGVQNCTKGQYNIPENCAVYLSSIQGQIAQSAELLRKIIEEKDDIMPISFINVSSNMAGFSIAQVLNLSGRNNAITNKELAFEIALEMALIDLMMGAVPMALVGVVEECSYPLTEHQKRLGLDSNALLSEGSAWLLLSAQAVDDAICKCRYSKRFSDIDLLLESLTLLDIPDNAISMLGTAITLEVTSQLQHHFSSWISNDNKQAYNRSLAIFNLIERLQQDSNIPLFYINGDSVNGYLLFWFEH